MGKGLIDLLSAFDPADTASGIAALQLLPQNSGHMAKLDAAAAIVASLPFEIREQTMSRHRWSTWLSPAELSKVAQWGEEPFPNLFVSDFTLPSQACRVTPGLESKILYTLKLLHRSLRGIPASTPARSAFLEQSDQLIRSVLAVSEELCERADLERGLRSRQSEGTVDIPASDKFRELKSVVTFSESALRELVERAGGSLAAIHDLARTEPAPWSGDPTMNPCLQRPFAFYGPTMVVSAPHSLLSATRTNLLKRIDDDDLRVAFVDSFRRSVMDDIESSMRHLGTTALQPATFEAISASDHSAFSHGFFRADLDKVVHVTLIVDTLIDYSSEEGHLRWETSDQGAGLERRLREADESIRAQPMTVNETVHIVALQGVGRFSTVGIDHESEECLTTLLEPDALEAIALLESGQPQTITQFARAAEAARNTTKVLSFGPLDEFATYRARHDSLYLTDDERPNFLFIGEDATEGLRAEIHRRFDVHGVWVPWTKRFEEVLIVGDGEFPLYTPRDLPEGQVALLLEVYQVPIWVIAPAQVPGSQGHELHELLGQVLAFWLWDLRSELNDLLARPLGVRHVQIEFEAESTAVWFQGKASTAGRGSALWVKEDGVKLSLGSDLAPQFHRHDNQGERELVRMLLGVLGRFVARATGREEGIPTAAIEGLLERHAPLGPKKQFLALRVDLNPRLNERDLPPFRRVQPAEIERVLDGLGPSLQKRLALSKGEHFTGARRVEVLNQAVTLLYEDLSAAVGQLEAKGLLERLVAQNEAVVHRDARTQLQLSTHAACYGNASAAFEKLAKQMPETSTAGVAGRFLVEYVTAQPPVGQKALSVGQYDRLLAIAAEIVLLGTASDLLHYGLADFGVSLLPSGRLGISRTEYEAARERFHQDFFPAEVTRSAALFRRHWRVPPEDDAQPERDDEGLDEAFQAEFGVPIGDLATFVATVVRIGIELPGEAKVLDMSTFLERVQREMGCSPETAQHALSLFVSRPRGDFLRVDAPFRKEDVRPWRFNRGLSYLRRPLLVRINDGKEELVWGFRQTMQSGDNLVSLCLSGRLKASSLEMRKFMGKIQANSAEAFNDRVGRLFESIGRFVVRTRVRKIGKERLRGPNGNDLGDIDVLAAEVATRVLWAIEAKDLELARTPAELANEVRETFSSTGDEPCAVDRHLARTDWLAAHRAEALGHLGLDTRGHARWRVTPVVVLDRELLGPYLKRNPLEVISYAQLKARLRPGA